ncbi:unnamed protein product [Didymodactylos carnosus]|uniref:Uncharacterized protein n=1 Tax=Didymodactylos carnosus TaxID=1234261 RepID=A0A8S2PBH5_9BILA|nr:unnamed protein product [Didymodactylos carnosus]CAF4046427.1 unnamed protein product [Didymodactylos carnosus]
MSGKTKSKRKLSESTESPQKCRRFVVQFAISNSKQKPKPVNDRQRPRKVAHSNPIALSSIRNRFCIPEKFFTTYYELRLVKKFRAKCSNVKGKVRRQRSPTRAATGGVEDDDDGRSVNHENDDGNGGDF